MEEYTHVPRCPCYQMTAPVFKINLALFLGESRPKANGKGNLSFMTFCCCRDCSGLEEIPSQLLFCAFSQLLFVNFLWRDCSGLEEISSQLLVCAFSQLLFMTFFVGIVPGWKRYLHSYFASKHAVVSMTRTLGSSDTFKETGVKVHFMLLSSHLLLHLSCLTGPVYLPLFCGHCNLE